MTSKSTTYSKSSVGENVGLTWVDTKPINPRALQAWVYMGVAQNLWVLGSEKVKSAEITMAMFNA